LRPAGERQPYQEFRSRIGAVGLKIVLRAVVGPALAAGPSRARREYHAVAGQAARRPQMIGVETGLSLRPAGERQPYQEFRSGSESRVREFVVPW
jgi:hypothetical protein